MCNGVFNAEGLRYVERRELYRCGSTGIDIHP
jgi:hypothetical protein